MKIVKVKDGARIHRIQICVVAKCPNKGTGTKEINHHKTRDFIFFFKPSSSLCSLPKYAYIVK